MNHLVADPWGVRNRYIEVILDRDRENVRRFLEKNVKRDLSRPEQIKMLKLLEIQHHAMLMYTSCGWFFDEVTGIETIQDMMYAARAIQLAQDLTGQDYETTFVELLKKCPSNLPEYGNAAVAYQRQVSPAIVDMNRVGAHYAVSSLFSDYPEVSKIYSYDAESLHSEYREAGKYRLSIGRVKLTSEITWEEKTHTYAVLHLGEHHLFGGVREYQGENSYQEMMDGVLEAFEKGRVHEVVVMMDKYFGSHNYSFWHLFNDEQQRILKQVISNTMDEVESAFKNIYENNYSLLQAMNELKIDVPDALRFCGDFSINARLQSILEEDIIDFREFKSVAETYNKLKINIDKVGLSFLVGQRINVMIEKLLQHPDNQQLLDNIVKLLRAIKLVQLSPDLWKAQNIAFVIQNYLSKLSEDDKINVKENNRLIQAYQNLFDQLNIKIKPIGASVFSS